VLKLLLIKNRCIMGNFLKLRVWQIAKNLAVKIYKLTLNHKFKYDLGFKDQVQRSAVSIPGNIAEGDESGTNKLSVRYFHVAKASAAELMTQLIIANEIGYIDDATKITLVEECDKISAMLSRLIQTRTTTK
jgi:four helix bundle protein